MTDEANLKQLTGGTGVNWSRANFQVILSSRVVNGMQGKPKVQAIAFWRVRRCIPSDVLQGVTWE